MGREREHPNLVVLCDLPFEEAWLFAGRLRDEGIEAMVSPEQSQVYPSLDTTHQVLVKEPDLEEARRILEGVNEGRDRV